MTALLDHSSDLAEPWRLRHVRILEVTVPPGNASCGCGLAGPTSLHEKLAGPLRALAPEEASVELDTVQGPGPALQRLRQVTYDLLLVHHFPPALEALELLRALRSADSTEAVIVMTSAAGPQLARECFGLGADTFSFEADAVTLALGVWRAAERAEMARHLQRLDGQRRRRLQREASESAAHNHALNQIVRGVGSMASDDSQSTAAADAHQHGSGRQWQAQYLQLLRLYVLMGAGNLTAEVAHWALLLAGAGVSVPQFFRLHLDCVDQLKQALGNRGTRHCDRRADLLLIELLTHLAHLRHQQPAHHSHAKPALADTLCSVVSAAQTSPETVP